MGCDNLIFEQRRAVAALHEAVAAARSLAAMALGLAPRTKAAITRRDFRPE